MSRFVKPAPGEQFPSEYDISSSEIADLIQRNPRTVSTRTISLAAAGTMVINEPGFGFVCYGFSTVDNSKYAEAFVRVGIGMDECLSDTSRVFPCKTGRGFVGEFSKLALSWPADPNASTNSLVFVVFKTRKYPWIGGLEAS